MSTIIPMWEHILVEPITEESVTNTGIVLPDGGKDKPWTGKVIAIWCGKRLEDGTCEKMDLENGDVIYFAKYAGDELDIENNGIKKKYLIVKYSSILAKKPVKWWGRSN